MIKASLRTPKAATALQAAAAQPTTQKPAGGAPVKPAVKPAAKPVAKPAAKPAEQPAIDVESRVVSSAPAGTQPTSLEDMVPEGGAEETTEQTAEQTAETPEQEPAQEEQTAEEPAQEEPTSEAVATRPSMAVSRPSEGDGIEGDWGREDERFPQLKVVQGNGPLSNSFNEGSVIYADMELFPAPDKKQTQQTPGLRIVPVFMQKQWREVLDKEAQDEGQTPRVVDTREQVEELGGEWRWVNGEKPNWQPSSKCVFLVEAPENTEHPGFCMELDGKNYAVALYYAGGGAFNACPRIIYNTAKTALLVPVMDGGKVKVDAKGRPIKRPLLWKCFWTMRFAKKSFGNFNPWHPIMGLQAKAETGPEVRAYCESLTHGNDAAADAANIDA